MLVILGFKLLLILLSYATENETQQAVPHLCLGSSNMQCHMPSVHFSSYFLWPHIIALILGQ